jgi:hypothetical protein
MECRRIQDLHNVPEKSRVNVVSPSPLSLLTISCKINYMKITIFTTLNLLTGMAELCGSAINGLRVQQ